MKQLMVGVVAAAALITSGIAQARPGERDYRDGSGSGGRPGSVVQASNPYHSTESMGLARGMARLSAKTNFHASRPGENDGASDRSSKDSKSMSRSGGGHGMAGSVKTSLNVYHTTEAMGMARAAQNNLKRTNFGASMPADSSGGSMDKAAKDQRSMGSMRGGGMSGAVKTSLNVYHTTEVMGVASGMRRMNQKTNFHASMPSDSSGANDKASKDQKVMAGGGAGGRAGGVSYGLNPYARVEQTGVARGMTRASKNAGGDAPSPKGLGADVLRPGDGAAMSAHTAHGSDNFNTEKTPSRSSMVP